MRGILEHSISAGVVSDDEKNAFPSMNHLAILIGCLLLFELYEEIFNMVHFYKKFEN